MIIYKENQEIFKLYINDIFLVDLKRILDIDLLSENYYDCSLNIPIGLECSGIENLINFDFSVKYYLNYQYQINILHTDNNINILDNFILENDNINYIYVENTYNFNLGYTRNLYKYLNLSENIIFTDSDMILEKKYIVIMLEQLKNYDIIKPYSNNIRYLGRIHKFEYINNNKEIEKPENFRLYSISGGMVLFKKKIFEECGGYEELNCYGYEDRFLDTIILNKEYKVKRNNFKIYHLWHPKNNYNLKYDNNIKLKLDIFNKKYYNFFWNENNKKCLHELCNHKKNKIDLIINLKKKNNYNLNLFYKNKYSFNINLKKDYY